jgi:predicted HicB family RNase H-like nuclease
MKRVFLFSALLIAAGAYAQETVAPKTEIKPAAVPEVKPEAKPVVKPEVKPEAKLVAKPETKAEIKQHKHLEYVPPPPIDEMAWAMQFDKNHDGILDDNEKAALQEGWKVRIQKISEFHQWEREFREKGYKEEKEFMQRQEKEFQELKDRRKKEYLEACQRFGVPPPKEENRKEFRPEKVPAINKGELKSK